MCISKSFIQPNLYYIGNAICNEVSQSNSPSNGELVSSSQEKHHEENAFIEKGTDSEEGNVDKM